MYCEWCGQEVTEHAVACPKNPFHPDRRKGQFVFANPSDRRFCPGCGKPKEDCACP